MRIIRRRGWEISESEVTPESVALNRRALLGSGVALLAATPGLVVPGPAQAEAAIDTLRAPNDNHRVGGWIRRFLET